jgi:hypothetical protein
VKKEWWRSNPFPLSIDVAGGRSVPVARSR